MTIWFRQHAHAFKGALAHLRLSPGNFIFNVLVVAFALALPIAGLTIIENVRPVSAQLSIEPEISIFLTPSTPRDEATALLLPIKQILKNANISAKLNFITKDKALAAMEETSSLAEVLATLGGNPLPDAYVLSLSNSDTEHVDSLVNQLKNLSHVDVVQVDSAWVKRLSALVHVLQVALVFLAISLSGVVVVVIFNATRLQVMSHQAEISITRLLGATNSFIHKPYYYTGALLGSLAGCVALALIAVSLHPLNLAIADFAKLYGSEFRLVPLGILTSFCLIAAATLLGLCGAYLSVRRQLSRII